MLSRSPRKRGAFSPSDALLLAPYRDRRYRGSPSAARAIRCLTWYHKKPAPGRFPNSVARSFDEPRRFHDAALPVYSRSLRKRGAFSPSMLSCWRHIGTDGTADLLQQPGRPFPALDTKSRHLVPAPESGFLRSFDEPRRFHDAALPVQTRSPRKRGVFSPSDALLLAPHREPDGRYRGAPSATRAVRFLLWTQKKPAPGKLRNPVSSAASMSRGDFTTRRCRCRPDRPVNAVCFHLQTLSCWRRIGTDGTAELLQLPGRPVWYQDTKNRRLIGSGIRLPRSFDVTQRFHGAVLPMQTRSPRKREAFSPSMLSCRRHIGTGGSVSPSTARAIRCLTWYQKTGAWYRLRNPVAPELVMSRGDFIGEAHPALSRSLRKREAFFAFRLLADAVLMNLWVLNAKNSFNRFIQRNPFEKTSIT
jgi:hypothetical protein